MLNSKLSQWHLFLFCFINYKFAWTPCNRDNFCRFPRNFAIEVSPLFQTTPVSAKKITVEGMGVFFSNFSRVKGKEKRKGKQKETCSQASTNNLALILTRVIYLGVPADDPYAFQPLKRISTVDLLSWLLCNKTWLHETGRHLSPVGGGRGGWMIQMATMVISDATNMKIAAQKATLQNLRL